MRPNDLERILKESYNDTIKALVQALELHGPGEGGHAERVSVYSVATGERLGLPFGELVDLRYAGALHDVGKICISPSLLGKLGELTEEEIAELRTHALMALKVVESFEWLKPTIPMIRHHHERWDGTGYPDQLRGEQIPLGARIIAVAETFDVMTCGDGWRKKLHPDHAIAELERCSGSQFDPKVVEAFKAVQPLIQPIDR